MLTVFVRSPRSAIQCTFINLSITWDTPNTHLREQNAGMSGPQKPIDEIELSDFMQVMNTNVLASFLCTQEAFKVFKSQEPQGGE